MDHKFRKDFVIYDVVVVEEWYGMEPLKSVMGTGLLVRSNPFVHSFTENLISYHHLFYANRIYEDRTAAARTDEK